LSPLPHDCLCSLSQRSGRSAAGQVP
jgi:hypothetical protein